MLSYLLGSHLVVTELKCLEMERKGKDEERKKWSNSSPSDDYGVLIDLGALELWLLLHHGFEYLPSFFTDGERSTSLNMYFQNNCHMLLSILLCVLRNQRLPGSTWSALMNMRLELKFKKKG